MDTDAHGFWKDQGVISVHLWPKSFLLFFLQGPYDGGCMTGYGKDLAYIHDAGFGGFARGAAPALLETLDAYRIAAGLVVDLGCGSGIWAAELLRAGYRVLGVDISAAMIRLARRGAPGARFEVASLLDFDLPRCDAVTAIGECINYTFDPRGGRNALGGLGALFGRVFRALRPGGVFIVDFAEPGQVPDGRLRWKYTDGPDWAVLVDAAEDRLRGTLTRRIVSFRRNGRWYRRSEERHIVRLYRGDELLAELRRIGFHAELFGRYGSMRLRPGCAGIVAAKPLI
jgi:SAM-dependent methyltransferase